MNKYHHANEEDYLTINSSTTQTTNKLFKKSTILSIIAIIISLVIAVIGILSFAATLITITIINNNNINTLLATNYDNYIENKPMLFHISEKEKFSFGLGNIENLNKVSQQLNIKIPDITIITNGNAILEYFNNETVALMKNAVDNYKTSIKCCKVALTGNLIEMGKCKNDPNTIEQCVDNVIANEMPKFVNVVPAGIVFINENYAKFRYFKP